jgi:N-acetylglucosamine transport system substrate-binding protein
MSDLNRRDVLKRTAAIGMLAGPAAGLLGACASGGGNTNSGTGSKTKTNPLGVKEDAPLDVVIFKGGYGDDWAKNDEALYTKSFPKAKIKHTGTQQITQLLQPRFVGGTPPDLVDNSGAQQMDTAGLADKGQLADLKPLLDAQSVDDPNKTVKDTLVPGTVELGTFGNDTVYVLNYAYSVYGLWYSKTLMDKHGWEYPKTWDAMVKLCGDIKKAGISPWAYAGKYPYYLAFFLIPFIGKIGGQDTLNAMDNLEPNAYKSDAVKTAVGAIEELAAKKFFLPGTEGLTHIESQSAWAQNKTVFIPNGSWVENEAQVPVSFGCTAAPPPSSGSSDKLPFASTWGAAGEPMIVPKQGKNVAGGMELLRIMLSKKGAQGFFKASKSLTSVDGALEGMDLTPGASSAIAVQKASGKDTTSSRIVDWYHTLWKDTLASACLDLATGRIKTAEWCNRMQTEADKLAKDTTIKHPKH